MKPYYEKDGITLYHGDCREILPSIDETFAVAITDPPYGETNLAWDRWPGGWPSIVNAAQLWCFGSMRMFLENVADFAGWRFVQDVVWEKHNGSGFLVDRFRRVHETVAHFVPDGVPWSSIYKSPQFTNDATPRVVRKKEKPPHWHGKIGPTTYVSEDGGPRLMRSVQRVRSMHHEAEHPTQKPVGIIAPLIEYSCPPRGIVLDLFAGSGSTLYAARDAGRRAIGIEIEERYCEVAAKRLAQGVFDFSKGPDR